MAPVRLDERTKMAAFSGLGWGLLIYLVWSPVWSSRRLLEVGPLMWVGILASPCIGMLVGRLSRPLADKERPAQIWSSLFFLYLAAVCFAIVAGAAGPLAYREPAALPMALLMFLWGVLGVLTGSGAFLLLWPLSFLNHYVLWEAELGRGPLPPQIPLTLVAFRTLGRYIVLLSVGACVLWWLFQPFFLDRHRFSALPSCWDLMGWSTWTALGVLVWLTAPLLASATTRAAGSQGPLTRTYADLVGVIGFAIVASPFLFWVARLLVVAIEMTLVQSWQTEGPVFAEAQYYRNVFWMHYHYLVVGFVLITLRWLTTNSRKNGRSQEIRSSVLVAFLLTSLYLRNLVKQVASG